MSHQLLVSLVVVTGLMTGQATAAESKRPITPADCVSVRYLLRDDSRISPIQFNPQGTKLAYLVKAPDLRTNTNNVELYIREMGEKGSTAESQPLLVASSISTIHWLSDGQHLTLLMEDGGRIKIEQLDVQSGRREVLVGGDQDIAEYTIDSDGRTIVFATEIPVSKSGHLRTQAEIESGYRIPFDDPETSHGLYRKIFVTLRNGSSWNPAKPIVIQSPFSGELLSRIPYYVNLSLSLSPDGSELLLSYADSLRSTPIAWKRNPFVVYSISNGSDAVTPTVLYNIASGKTSLAFNSPQSDSLPRWSPGGRAFVIVSKSPVGSLWEEDDIKKNRAWVNLNHLFWVDPHSGRVELVAPFVWSLTEQPLVWTKDDQLEIHVLKDQVGHFEHQSDGWKLISSVTIPDLTYLDSEIASNGKIVIGSKEDAMTPPHLFAYVPGDTEVKLIADLNPIFRNRSLARTRTIEWKTSTGYDEKGLLWLPIDYTPGTAYPLVIQTKPYTGGFACDYGEFHYPSFAPEPLASANIMYLTEMYNEDPSHYASEQAHYPKEYPGIQGIGGVAEAAFEMDKWESAVQTLRSEQLIDEKRVGIIGFSRSGWYTEFALFHSKVKYRAATAADNVQYSLGEYWSLTSSAGLHGFENVYGGPPFGKTLKNWMDYSISFNMEKIHTPLLIEAMGGWNSL